MAIIRLDGTLQLTKSGSRSVVTLWETKLNQQTQQDQKTASSFGWMYHWIGLTALGLKLRVNRLFVHQ